MESDLKSKIVDVVDSIMKNQSKCEVINFEDEVVWKSLLQNKGGFDRELTKPEFRGVVKVRWDKEKMFFGCTIAFLEKRKNKKWHCYIRFDDAHNGRHLDADLGMGKTKIFDGKLTLIKIECPILFQIIKSLPKEKAEVWKIKLFEEFVVGNKKYKDYLNNPNRIQFYESDDFSQGD